VARDRSLRLRTRVTLFFGFIALLAGAVLIAVTYGFARTNLLDERRTSAEQQAFENANEVAEVLDTEPENVGLYFQTDLRPEPGGFALLDSNDPNFDTCTDCGYQVDDFPERLVVEVRGQGSGVQFADIEGDPYATVGVYIARHDTGYFEAFPATTTETTLRAVLTALAAGAAGTILLATLFGFSTSRRLLRPLGEVADAAEEIASGGLDTRLDRESDPDLDRLANSFNDMADAVQTRIEREARFASDVSHELRSPITAMTAAVEVLDSRRDELSERTQQALDVVVSQVRRFDSMVIDLLELSRMDAGAADLNVEPVDLLAFTERIAARYDADDVPIDVLRRAPREVVLDKVRYERILGNLLENARIHADGALRIEISAERGKRFRVAVEDGGPGVAQSERERIFERFARGSAARHQIGTGLGLALVAEHSAAMGGSAWVEDRPQGGSRFVIELPVNVTGVKP
jgi:signal transduction histidine kinase